MTAREATSADLDGWVELRRQLWPDAFIDSLRSEAASLLASPDEVCFLVVDPSGTAIGFAEAAIHQARSGPYAHLEGWYVVPNHRGRGLGQALVDCVEQWCLHRAICKLTSDTTPSYPLSQNAHERAGFKRIREFTVFLKELQQPSPRDSQIPDTRND